VLTESSYHTAIYTYTGAACAIVLILGIWLRRHWRPVWVALVVLLGAALLLTPAYPREDAATLAPALIVAGFRFLTDDPQAAGPALGALAFTSGVAVALALLLQVTLFRRHRRARRPPRAAESG
jgi:hypothetical protein